MKYKYKKQLTKIKRIFQNPGDFKYLNVNKKVKQSGMLLVIHESQELGASILALHIAEELKHRGVDVYIVSRQFGVMNEKYNKVAPLQIALNTKSYEVICRNLYKKGYRKALIITASNGDLVEITKKCGFKVVSMIHELEQVIKMLHLEDATRDMLVYSDKILFSTSIAKNQILSLCKVCDSQKISIKPQGTYLKKPSSEEIKRQREKIAEAYPVLDCGKKVIAGVGNTTERKGFDIFLQTAALIPECEFIWAGKKENYYDEAIEKNGNPSNFIFLGSLNAEQLSGVYSLADIYLMCSRFDTLPSTILEALLFGTPVIGAKNSGGIVDIIDSDNGFLTETADSKQFAEAIKVGLTRNYKIEEIYGSFAEYVAYVLSLYEDE